MLCSERAEQAGTIPLITDYPPLPTILNMCADSKVFVRVSKIIYTLYNNYDAREVEKNYAYRYALVYVYVPVHEMFFDLLI